MLLESHSYSFAIRNVIGSRCCQIKEETGKGILHNTIQKIRIMEGSEKFKDTADKYSCAEPESMRVTSIYLDLKVDFSEQVLEGKALLTINKESSSNQVILDIGDLIIESVNLPIDTVPVYHVRSYTKLSGQYGNLLIIKIHSNELPYTVTTYQIEIKYRTSKNSNALIWLTREQSVDGTNPFLVSNTKYAYARTLFPCQDSPRVKFKYSAKITVPTGFTVVSSAPMTNSFHDEDESIFVFDQPRQIPPYGVAIAVGQLETQKLGSKSIVFAEEKYIDQSVRTFAAFESILQIAERICGPYWDLFQIFVLPSNIPTKYCEIYPNVIFISPAVLDVDICLVTSLAKQIPLMWTEYLVTPTSYFDFWLSKSLGLYIYTKIIREMQMSDKIKQHHIDKEIHYSLKEKIDKELYKKHNYQFVPQLTDMSIQDLNKSLKECVPYEIGYLYLEKVEFEVGGAQLFESYLRHYFFSYAGWNVNAENWIQCLEQYFLEKKEELHPILWFTPLTTTDVRKYSTVSKTSMETFSLFLAEEWLEWTCLSSGTPPNFQGADSFSDIEKIFILRDIHDLIVARKECEDLSGLEIDKLTDILKITNNNYEIWFYWLCLCIANRCSNSVQIALDFVTQYCWPSYARRIFKELYDWPEMREKAIAAYNQCKIKFLPVLGMTPAESRKSMDSGTTFHKKKKKKKHFKSTLRTYDRLHQV
ncbi:PREDICTED: leukotriene A-4 hydrolase-like [Vollenhovia emeryi]|uniref:leukotriene A-4 hydrolase-like n=1 Tax=Vollenhovia emeryi TaxID=411798 RepID=UPI0005F4B273|nr:PREDICTED: leukotriene A-4 hydrolase-like [Vollenhovia emeryi]